MSFSMSVESQDNALTDASPVKSNARALAAGSWWRFSRYEIRDGYIRPAPGARLRRYDPWKRWHKTRAVNRRSDGSVRGATPYRELLEMLNKLEYRSVGADSPEFTPAQVDMLAGPLTADSEQRILNWCARYGLLGILQHRLLQVVLSPRNGAQVEYRRISLGWAAVERVRENPFTPILEPHAVVQPLRGFGLTAEPLSETWARFFPGCTGGGSGHVCVSPTAHQFVLGDVCRAAPRFSLGCSCPDGIALRCADANNPEASLPSRTHDGRRPTNRYPRTRRSHGTRGSVSQEWTYRAQLGGRFAAGIAHDDDAARSLVRASRAVSVWPAPCLQRLPG